MIMITMQIIMIIMMIIIIVIVIVIVIVVVIVIATIIASTRRCRAASPRGSGSSTPTDRWPPRPALPLLGEQLFARCFLLEISLRGFPFQMNFSETYRVPNNNTNLISQTII